MGFASSLGFFVALPGSAEAAGGDRQIGVGPRCHGVAPRKLTQCRFAVPKFRPSRFGLGPKFAIETSGQLPEPGSGAAF
jgi:hypothetical protein